MINKFQDFHMPRYDEIPDIDLYMDQLLAYIDKVLGPLFVNQQEKILTTSMVNNYVKLKDIYLIDSYKEDRVMIITMLSNKAINIGLLVIIENEQPINQTSFEIINQFKKFILKQLES